MHTQGETAEFGSRVSWRTMCDSGELSLRYHSGHSIMWLSSRTFPQLRLVIHDVIEVLVRNIHQQGLLSGRDRSAAWVARRNQARRAVDGALLAQAD